MDEEHVQSIRVNRRNTLMLNRRHQRCETSDELRSLSTLKSISVLEIANKLKTKCSMSVAELNGLKNALYNDKDNIEIFLKTHGALGGLVREISGCDVNKQLAAAACLCNLGLTDTKAAMAVAKAAGPYLAAGLDSFVRELAVTNAYTIGNLCAANARVCAVLSAQGCISKLCDLMTSKEEDLQTAAIFALKHYCREVGSELRVDLLKSMISNIIQLHLNFDLAQILFYLSCHEQFQLEINDSLLLRILSDFSNTIDSHLSNCDINKFSEKECCKIIYLIRVLANCAVTENCEKILSFFDTTIKSYKLSALLNSSFSNLRESLLWLLGNLYVYCNDRQLFNYIVLQ